MSNRRQFIQSAFSLAVLSWPGVRARTAPPATFQGAELALERFVFDSRYAEAVESARGAARRGVLLAEVSGDLMELWYGDLDLRWRDAPEALAGVTTQAELFVLETLAADRRMRVVYRGQHAAPRAGLVSHRLIGSERVIAAARRPGAAAAFWTDLGEALTCCPSGRRPPVTYELSTLAGKHVERTEPLVSWIIAPLHVAAPAGEVGPDASPTRQPT